MKGTTGVLEVGASTRFVVREAPLRRAIGVWYLISRSWSVYEGLSAEYVRYSEHEVQKGFEIIEFWLVIELP